MNFCIVIEITVKIMLFWFVTQCGFAGVYKRFGGTCSLSAKRGLRINEIIANKIEAKRTQRLVTLQDLAQTFVS